MERMGEHRNCKLAQTNLNTDLDQGGLILLYLNWTSLYFFWWCQWVLSDPLDPIFTNAFLSYVAYKKKKKSKSSQKLKESFYEKWKVVRV